MIGEYQTFFELSLDLLCIAGQDGYFKKLNHAWERTLGFSAEELCSRPFVDFVHPEDRESTVRAAESLGQGKDVANFTNRYRTKGGGYRWLTWAATASGGLIYAVAHDSTTQRLAESERDNREQQLQSIAHHAPGMLYQFRRSPQGDFSFPFSSPHCQEIFGLPASKLAETAEPAIARIHPEDLPAFAQALADTTDTMTPFRWEGRILNARNQYRWIRAASDPRHQEDGSILWDGILLDVTPEKEAQSLIEAQRANLVHSSKLAALGEMAGNIAHEINNPLAILKGFAEQIQRNLTSHPPQLDKAEEAVSKMDSTVDRIAKIVSSLRRQARDPQGDPLDFHGLAPIVNDALGMCRERLRTAGIALQEVSPPNELTVCCRPVGLGQVLVNLLNNSRDAVEALGERWIRIETSFREGIARITVTDSGPGIPSPLREKIMLPFFTTKPIGKGTGLGLGISKGLLESYGGTLALDPESPHTRFVISLPGRLSSEGRP